MPSEQKLAHANVIGLHFTRNFCRPEAADVASFKLEGHLYLMCELRC